MYESRTEPHEFVGEGRADAVAKATKHFGLDESALAITEYRAGEVYGAAGRVVIVAVPRDRPAPSRDGGGREARSRGPREERGERGRREERGGRGRGGRGERDRGERGDRDRGERGDRDRGDRGGRERDRGARGERGDRGREPQLEEPAPAREEPSGPSVGTAQGELGELGGFVLGVVERLDLGPFEISETEDAEVIVVQLRGEGARRLAEGQGRTVDALQLLVNQAAMRSGEERQRVVVDVEGDADSREAFLGSLAARVARRALDSGRAVALDPMSPKDRRVIHVALRDEEDIATMSIGEGRFRQVVVVPRGAPEFDEARRTSEGD